MGVPSDPHLLDGPPGGEPVTCPRCGWTAAAARCTAPGCENRFFPQPGYSRTVCPLHDAAFEGVPIPEGFRDYKLEKARGCARCGAPCFGTG